MDRFREPFSGFTHLGGALAAVGGLGWLTLATRHDPAKLVTMLIYGLSLVALYSSSTALHLVKASERVINVLNRIDHAAIYVLTAGTYTPFCYNLLTGGWRWGMLIAVWSMALVGVLYKLFYPWKRDSHLSTAMYVGMGWLGIIMLPQMLTLLPPAALALIVGGGLIYTSGAILYALDKPEARPPRFSYHDAWHVFVLLGSLFHFIAVLVYVA